MILTSRTQDGYSAFLLLFVGMRSPIRLPRAVSRRTDRLPLPGSYTCWPDNMDGSSLTAESGTGFCLKGRAAMVDSGPRTTRRHFISRSALLTGSIGLGLDFTRGDVVAESETEGGFSSYQKRRREALWGLLGDLPWQHEPGPPRVVRREEHDGYTLERLILDLNGVEPVPALLLIPKRLSRPAPGLLFIHWHAGMYELGKEQLLRGTNVQPAYAPVLAETGIITPAIDSWCFGERQHDANGKRGEEDTFKLMLWNGQVLWGMMMFDEFRTLTYLASRQEVDSQRLGVSGMSMGSTKSWWLAALDPRVCVTMDG